jgi:hypothetical protein
MGSGLALPGGGDAVAESAPDVGSAQKVMPRAGATLNGEQQDLAAGSVIHRDEALWTGAGGGVEIGFLDGSVVRIGENARLVLDDFVLPENGTASLILRSVSGALRFAGGAIDHSASNGSKDGTVKIVTPIATMVVRGTDFFAGPIDGAYGVFVFHGRVQVATSGGSVSLNDGEGTSMSRSSDAPSPVKRWGAAKIKRAEALVGF